MYPVVFFCALLVLDTAQSDNGQRLSSGLTVQLHVLPILAYRPPGYLDWRVDGYVSRVKDQGQCDSGWAFAAAGSIESLIFFEYRKQLDLSVQQLIDCSSSYGTLGCKGGNVTDAFDYVIAIGGIEKDQEAYPYEETVGQCRANSSKFVARISSYARVAEGNETALLEAVKQQPVAVTIDASQPSFYNYNQGIYYEPNCSSTNLDHAMLVVGYGTNPLGEDYWIVKNSYGFVWGEWGYIRMARNRGNNCGIATRASYPRK